MTEEYMKQVSIGGIKVEVDTRTATVVEQYRVGDPVKLLITESGSSTVNNGVIVEFENFSKLPTIVVAYVSQAYWDSELRFANINIESAEKYEIVPCSKDTQLMLDKGEYLARLDAKISESTVNLAELKAKKAYFKTRFGAYFKGEPVGVNESIPEEVPT